MAKEVLPLDQWSNIPYTAQLTDMKNKYDAAIKAHIMSVLAANGYDTKVPDGYTLVTGNRFGQIGFGFMSARQRKAAEGKLVFRPSKTKTT